MDSSMSCFFLFQFSSAVWFTMWLYIPEAELNVPIYMYKAIACIIITE